MPLVVRGDFAGLDATQRDQLLSTELARGVRALNVTFEPVAPETAAGERLVVVLNPTTRAPADTLCATRRAGSAATSGEDERIIAAFCRGDEALSAVSGAIEGSGTRERNRLIWRTADALFPDDYEDTYGLGLLPDRGGGGGGGGY